MYHAQFGLERGLFGDGIATDAAVFRTAKHDRLVAHFKLAFASASSGIVLHGAAGVGKTTLTATALRATSTRLALAWLNGMPTNAAELLELILVELGVATLRTTRIERLQLWRQFQAELRATDSRLFLVAERAEDLSFEVLHALDQLTAPDAVGNPGANFVLLGHAGIDEHLGAPLLDSLRQRVRLRAELEPFTEAELQDYLRHQAARAGGSFDRIFAPGAVAALYRYSGGITRLVNTLCESTLDIAAVQQHKLLTAELIAKTAVTLLGLAEPAPARPAQVLTPAPQPAAALRAAAAVTKVAPSEGAALPPPAAAQAVPAVAAPAVAAHVSPPAAAPAQTVTPTPSLPAAPPPAAAVPVPAPATAPPLASVVVAPPAPRSAPLPAAPPPQPAPPAAVLAPQEPADVEYDGSATDVADVALTDFPVLTDAVEAPLAPPAPKAATPPVEKQPLPPPVNAAVAPPTPAKPAARPFSRIETAYTATRPPGMKLPPVAAPSPPPPAARVAPKPAAAPPRLATPAPADADADDDVLRQTQTLRAIASAKSIDDISELDAETLFGDAGLDLVSAALASAAEWPDDDVGSVPAPTPAPTPPPAKPAATKSAPVDDPFDLFGLDDNAPLELIDDSAPPRKAGSR